ncbi:hypothetical protein RJP56_07905 [Shewanella baltica]|jgi:hypothetical protein|uniref:DUF2474 domain-containing protein n=4 Tax=Shewanella TaxID=22 RepID=A9L268_SHEB9|nr:MULTISPECIES: hypothetical protein [Shewanella]EGT3626661.1 hypothetical protein [Morganella morganii]ABN61658.1 conserved hypothetical protein [Shewanella baltica OS155]ABS08349.1 conserved hypothetical protein [Shewanella baltica OS185]ABX49486.1 conserved hypothetical protein [Shewanella baltica OS195]ACK46696.1 conserved hypothetical protein [Shewanella baltica OS223]
MDKGQRYLRWLSYTAVIAVFFAVMLATIGKAVWVVLENVK